MSLGSKIEELNIFTKPQVAALKKIGLLTAQNLLLYFPRKYLDFSQTKNINDLTPGENISLKVTVKEINKRFSFRSHMSIAEALASDDTGTIKVVWFNQGYIADQLGKGEQIFLSGQPEVYKNILQLTNPIYEKVSDFPLHTARLVPVYRLPEKVYPKTFRRAIAAILPLANQLIDAIPASIISNQQLLSLPNTVRKSHFPEKVEDAQAAKKRLAFEEIFYNQLLAQKHKLELAQKQSFSIKFDQNLIKSFLAILPFELTPGQKKSAWDVFQDLEKPMPMNRLLEGDVGSGKTLVALMAALEAVSSGLQAALLAPTEILANQHFNTAQKYLFDKTLGRANYQIQVILITNNFGQINGKKESKEKIKKLINEGMPGLYIGTHALLQKNIKFKKLALVIIDEQHRFGVEQRAELMKVDGKVPHLLSLSATPIPRTLQLAFYGELDISQIKTKPVGRKSIVTKLVDAQNRKKAYQFISDQIKSGRQAFVITPLIEENETLQVHPHTKSDAVSGSFTQKISQSDYGVGVKAAKSEVENLKKIFPEFNIGLMHGRLKGTEKEKVMREFLENKVQILVSTSVVEVGVDVPNASVMMIEGAERFGLAQLHQFRGRVGRAEHQSYCFLFPSSPLEGEDVAQRVTGEGENKTLNRLQSFTKTQDGFELAELDLKLRGFGDVYGSLQSGWNFKYFNPSYTSLIEPARQEALNLLRDDLNLENYPLLKEKIQNKTVHFE